MEVQTDIFQSGFNPEYGSSNNCSWELDGKTQDEAEETTSCSVTPYPIIIKLIHL